MALGWDWLVFRSRCENNPHVWQSQAQVPCCHLREEALVLRRPYMHLLERIAVCMSNRGVYVVCVTCTRKWTADNWKNKGSPILILKEVSVTRHFNTSRSFNFNKTATPSLLLSCWINLEWIKLSCCALVPCEFLLKCRLNGLTTYNDTRVGDKVFRIRTPEMLSWFGEFSQLSQNIWG